jgi:hypothetical protein
LAEAAAVNALTTLRAPNGRAVNKVVSRAAAGIQKAMARNDGVFAARTINAPDAATMATSCARSVITRTPRSRSGFSSARRTRCS